MAMLLSWRALLLINQRVQLVRQSGFCTSSSQAQISCRSQRPCPMQRAALAGPTTETVTLPIRSFRQTTCKTGWRQVL